MQPRDADWATLLADYPELPGVRQIFLCEISELQTSCGFGVLNTSSSANADPQHLGRDQGRRRAAGVLEDNNLESIDGLATGLDVDR